MRDDDVNCEALKERLRQGRELTRDDSAHLDDCDACTDAWLTAALEAKPEVQIPVDFAARVAANLPSPAPRSATKRRPRNWGLATAMAMIGVFLAVFFAGPSSANSPPNAWLGPLFLFLVTGEIAGLALWLGPRWMGR